jgi:hypothetical protein
MSHTTTEKIQKIHLFAVKAGEAYRKSEADLLLALSEVDQNKVHIHLGYSSLFDYALKALKLSEACAFNLITVSRKSRLIPELKEAVVSGQLSISKARKITPVLTKENSAVWIEKAISLPKAKLEKEVAALHPQTLTVEKMHYVSQNRLELKLGLDEKTLKKLKRVQDLLSQKNKCAASFEEAIEAMVEVYLERNDPVLKAKRCLKKRSQDPIQKPVPGQMQIPRPLPTRVKHQVHVRDRHQCTHVDRNGDRCPNQRWLEIHHLKSFAQGGLHEISNLVTLCSAHHAHLHLS